jgi:hypothetical protein
MLLLETSSNETSFVSLKCTIKAGLNLIDPLTSDRMDTGRKRNKLPSAVRSRATISLAIVSYHSG